MLAKFYPLDRAEWLRACHELTPSERDVLYFIRTSDPYSNGIRVNSAAIARQLSSPQHKVHRQTVSRALKSLVDKGFIEIEILESNVKVLGGGKHSNVGQPDTDAPLDAPPTCGKEVSHHTLPNPDTPKLPHQPVENGCATTPMVSHHTTVDRDTPTAIVTHPLSSETQTAQQSQESKIFNTYKEDLSERGEKFFEMKEIKNLIQADRDLTQPKKAENFSQGLDRKSLPKPKLSGEDSKSPAPPQTAKNSLEIAKGNKDFMDWAIRRSTRLNARNAEIHATTCLKRDEALTLWQEYQRSQTRPQPLYLEFNSPAEYAAYIEKRREELLYGMAS